MSHSDTAGTDEAFRFLLQFGQSLSTPEFHSLDLHHGGKQYVKTDVKVSEAVLHSMTSSWEKSAAIICLAALLLRVHHRTCTSL